MCLQVSVSHPLVCILVHVLRYSLFFFFIFFRYYSQTFLKQSFSTATFHYNDLVSCHVILYVLYNSIQLQQSKGIQINNAIIERFDCIKLNKELRLYNVDMEKNNQQLACCSSRFPYTRPHKSNGPFIQTFVIERS